MSGLRLEVLAEVCEMVVFALDIAWRSIMMMRRRRWSGRANCKFLIR